MKRSKNWLWLTLPFLLLACAEDPIPRPRGYFHIDFPEKNYMPYTTDCGFEFEIPGYARVVKYRGAQDQPCSFNMVFPQLRATLYLTHLSVNGDLDKMLEDAYTMTHKHDAKTNSIKRIQLEDDLNQKYGLTYLLGGNVATPFQFYLHDSTANFLRGSLYFQNIPNADSLAPAIDFITADLNHFIDTFQWPSKQ